ncbi:MAG: pyrroloquinoline-quinone synthase PqqC [Kiloniellaceae bacterium]
MTLASPSASDNVTPLAAASGRLLSREEFEERIRQIGAERYHSRHPFHKLLHGGKCSHGQVQAWVLNRYCYQSHIPLKDATILSRMEDQTLRREWRKRIEDHDGSAGNEGGIERWLVLAEGVGLDRAYVVSGAGMLPATRFAVEAYVHFVREKSLLEAIASSLTELFAPKIHQERIAGLLEHYDFANERTIAYFKRRLDEAPEDVKFGLGYVLREARSREQQEQVLAAVRFKTDVLWAQLDALYHAYVSPGHIPPGAFVPEGMVPVTELDL